MEIWDADCRNRLTSIECKVDSHEVRLYAQCSFQFFRQGAILAATEALSLTFAPRQFAHRKDFSTKLFTAGRTKSRSQFHQIIWQLGFRGVSKSYQDLPCAQSSEIFQP